MNENDTIPIDPNDPMGRVRAMVIVTAEKIRDREEYLRAIKKARETGQEVDIKTDFSALDKIYNRLLDEIESYQAQKRNQEAEIGRYSLVSDHHPCPNCGAPSMVVSNGKMLCINSCGLAWYKPGATVSTPEPAKA